MQRMRLRSSSRSIPRGLCPRGPSNTLAQTTRFPSSCLSPCFRLFCHGHLDKTVTPAALRMAGAGHARRVICAHAKHIRPRFANTASVAADPPAAAILPVGGVKTTLPGPWCLNHASVTGAAPRPPPATLDDAFPSSRAHTVTVSGLPTDAVNGPPVTPNGPLPSGPSFANLSDRRRVPGARLTFKGVNLPVRMQTAGNRNRLAAGFERPHDGLVPEVSRYLDRENTPMPAAAESASADPDSERQARRNCPRRPEPPRPPWSSG